MVYVVKKGKLHAALYEIGLISRLAHKRRRWYGGTLRGCTRATESHPRWNYREFFSIKWRREGLGNYEDDRAVFHIRALGDKLFSRYNWISGRSEALNYFVITIYIFWNIIKVRGNRVKWILELLSLNTLRRARTLYICANIFNKYI